jgi:hypothetical protein
MSKIPRNEVLFDGEISVDRPLAEIWAQSTPHSPLSPRRDMRYFRTGNLLLRDHYLDDFDNASDVGLNIAEASRHFSQLRRFGMCVVSHLTEPLDIAYSESGNSDIDVVAAYSASAYVANCRSLDKPSAQAAVKTAKFKEFILEPLDAYLHWCTSEKNRGKLLSDIYRPDQYSWQTSSGVIFLHDIAPVMVEASLEMTEVARVNLANNF